MEKPLRLLALERFATFPRTAHKPREVHVNLPQIVRVALLPGVVLALTAAATPGRAQSARGFAVSKDSSTRRAIGSDRVTGESWDFGVAGGGQDRHNLRQIALFGEATTADASPVSGALPRRASRKSPALAWMFSFIFPGAGQAYNGQVGKAVPMFIMGGVGYAAMGVALSGGTCDSYSYDGGCTDDTYAIVAAAGVIIYVAGSIWSQIDAPISAGKINRNNGVASLQIGPKIVPLTSAAPRSLSFVGSGAVQAQRPKLGLSLASVTF